MYVSREHKCKAWIYKTDEYKNEFLFCEGYLLYIMHRAKEHDEYMYAEVIPDSDQLSSMYPVFVATVIIAVATAREAPQGKYRSRT